MAGTVWSKHYTILWEDKTQDKDKLFFIAFNAILLFLLSLALPVNF